MVKVSVAQIGDINAVSVLWLKMVREENPKNKPRVDWWIEQCNKLITSQCYYMIIAKEDNKIIGFIDGFYCEDPSTGKIHGTGQYLYVLPEYRNSNIAAMLYRKLIKIANTFNVQVREVFSVKSKEGFWLKKGYQIKRRILRKDL